MQFQLDDSVRVVRLLEFEREISGLAEHALPPRVGDVAAIVADVGEGIYVVESRTDDGVVRWTAEFVAEELELVERPM